MPIDDGVLEVPVERVKEKKMDPQIAKQMEMNFASHHRHLDDTAGRFNDGSAFVAQESKQMFLHAKNQIGVDALNKLEQDGTATLAMLLNAAKAGNG